jgi:hypothetical protein
MATTPDLYQQIFNSGDIWNVSSQLTKVNSDTMFVLFKAGLMIGFGAACIQLFSAIFHVYRNKNTNLMDFVAPLILKIILVGIFLTPAVYQAFVAAVFAAPADAAANMVTHKRFAKQDFEPHQCDPGWKPDFNASCGFDFLGCGNLCVCDAHYSGDLVSIRVLCGTGLHGLCTLRLYNVSF